ncbi:MAG: ComF family protein [Rhodovibrionaceae bacterium]
MSEIAPRLFSLRAAAFRLIDAVLPPRCLACGTTVETPGTLCVGCWSALDWLAPPLCAACGLPFEFEQGPDALCGGCLAERPAYGRARAALRYDDASKAMLLRFKHADRTEAAPSFAAWMGRAGAELLAEADWLAPVPLHRRRLFERRYNQAALLAHALGRGKPVIADLLLRKRYTPSQGRRSRAERQKNVAGAFAVAPRHRAALAGKKVLLIDDVMTTGATLEACAKTLLRGGAAAVDALTMARVVRR